MSNPPSLAAYMDAHNVKRTARYPIAGYCWVELHDGREGTGSTFAEAIERAHGEQRRAA
jgi:hypothetical protein